MSMITDKIEDDIRVLSPAELLAWAEDNTQVMRLRTFRDVIPGGYMAAMAPLLVDWRSVDTDSAEQDLVLRNVNYGGNPLERITVLHSLHFNTSAVEFAEFILVPPPPETGGRFAPWYHVQLRFVFEAGREAQLLNLAGSDTGTDARIPDLILSWESWRSPDKRFDVVSAMDTAAYGLSLRAYAGPQRFLEDTLHQQNWFSYRLRMPGGRAGVSELLKVALALGDGVARHTISALLQQSEADWLRHAPPGDDDAQTAQQWQFLRERAQYTKVSDDPALRLGSGEKRYQTLVRSCSTLTRYAVLVAAGRLVQRGHSDGVVLDKLPEPVLHEPEPWMGDMAGSSLKGLFLRAPLALRYIISHPETLPNKIPDEFAEAGLVAQQGGKAQLREYSQSGIRPYGAEGINPKTRTGDNGDDAVSL
jgi:hypothetical protein